jgi:hypothetical protein
MGPRCTAIQSWFPDCARILRFLDAVHRLKPSPTADGKPFHIEVRFTDTLARINGEGTA